MTQLKKMPPVQNVIANNMATLTLPLSETFERLVCVLGGTFTKAMILNIRVKLNGKVIHDCTGADLDVMNNYNGLASNASILSIDFSELFARDAVWQSVGAIGTASDNVQSLMVEFDIGAATNPTLTVFANVSGPKILAGINKLSKATMNIAAGNVKTPLPVAFGASGGALIKRIYIKSANMTALEVKRNGVVIHDSIKAVNDFYQQENKKVPQTGWYIFDAVVENNGNDMIDVTNNDPNNKTFSFEVNVTLSASEFITYYVETIDVLGNC
ncbi:hypothetical protein HQ393_04605 [Chitinibacter bivalviorum]|uniref:Uncharacterized protein n=1 Tax=Chitinibacter bivalviorum TaxID=2739434 RepID=A0A7H9BGQ0_9NEIS|nr:major capsid protein P2 [Chitinibacter bivalviorum]QLG87592.1 hypothetical protein HQ393_04605 [Chitinibacter bivalviorum]